MTKLFIARVRGAGAERPLVTVRAAAEGEARLFLEAAYPDDEIVDVTEPGEWVSTSDTGTKAGDVREHPGVSWQPPTAGAG
ncbi:hypothetical protein [Methylobacterium gnaphalii]|uniref:Uncharacterized protein n=1 Tax=Methylobacterium gnaphalii TaxID=1010610 RepID=A0A512JQX8_9HYPH|nr:hypothetical protein [Methylobacterium gnaphalii]GEP12360.1 hypothetical protein MGN01_42050 [Methylobacterium gnaphalii]GJD71260.1 hypothetical protein MMMDOFMJ_4215 [Methylobacterium gnaphalii]GLS48571.1 hypothetical protein GCM10007885_14150 [Methylobacterium gnaphalii]